MSRSIHPTTRYYLEQSIIDTSERELKYAICYKEAEFNEGIIIRKPYK